MSKRKVYYIGLIRRVLVVAVVSFLALGILMVAVAFCGKEKVEGGLSNAKQKLVE